MAASIASSGTALSAVEARFLAVGAYAAMQHIPPRYTKDLDIWVDASPENAVRVYAALRAFGAPIGDLVLQDLAPPGARRTSLPSIHRFIPI